MGIIFENVNHGRKMAWTFLQNCFPNFGLKHIWMYIELVMYLFDNTSQPLTKLLYMLSSLKMWKLEWLINFFINMLPPRWTQKDDVAARQLVYFGGLLESKLFETKQSSLKMWIVGRFLSCMTFFKTCLPQFRMK